jgi:hypothetical protein
MPINDRYAFVHIPKTGGSSVAVLMGRNTCEYRPHELTGSGNGIELTHLTATEMQQRIGWDSRLWFAVLRNPWDRMVSEYAYCIGLGVFPYMPGERPTFPEFIRFVTSPNRPAVFDDDHGGKHLRPQVDFIFDDHGQILVDKVFLFRHIERVGPELFGAPTPHVNASNHRPWWEWYKADTATAVGLFFRDDARITYALTPDQARTREATRCS